MPYIICYFDLNLETIQFSKGDVISKAKFNLA